MTKGSYLRMQYPTKKNTKNFFFFFFKETHHFTSVESLKEAFITKDLKLGDNRLQNYHFGEVNRRKCRKFMVRHQPSCKTQFATIKLMIYLPV